MFAAAHSAQRSAKADASQSDAVQRKAKHDSHPALQLASAGGNAALSGYGAVHETAAAGVSGSGSPIPHKAALEQSFGTSLDHVSAHTGSAAVQASGELGAQAYTRGNDVAFGSSSPSLHLAAHEATHTFQQKAGVQLKGGVGQSGDAYEREADQVADLAASGQSAAHIIGKYSGGGSGGAVQAKSAPSAGSQSLRATLTQALSGSSQSAGAGAVQFALKDDMTSTLNIYGPIDLDGLLRTIRAAPVNERQDAVNDATLRALIISRMGDSATIVMSHLLEGSQKWRNPTGNDFFNYFVTNNGSGTLPNTATMNCWESIIYAAYLAGKVTAAWIRTFYTNALAAPDANVYIWTTLGFNTGLPTHPGTTARAGQLLFYHTGGAIPGHVALALGDGKAMSLWHSPNNIDTVQRLDIGDLAGTVYIANPPW